ncbi:MAG: NosD domain-containing protein [Archaeoglobaceae archaeon]
MRNKSLIGIAVMLFLVVGISPAFAIFLEIGECTNITEETYYRLNRSIGGLQSGQNYCLNVLANNVTIDGNGYSITDDNYDGYGIYINGFRNVKIINVNISGYNTGIEFYGANRNTIENSTIWNNTKGVFIDFSNYNKVANSTISDNEVGVYINSSSENNQVYLNDFVSNGQGVYISFSNNNILLLNNFMDNEEQAYSESGLTNFWNSSVELTYSYQDKIYQNHLGNYWSDYSGSATGGVGNEPYTAGNLTDYSPLIEPKENYMFMTVNTISSCSEITSAGYYVLTRDLNGLKSGEDYCIKISANDVVLNGQDFKLTGVRWNDGMRIESVSNVTVKNITISNYYNAINMVSTSNSKIFNSTLKDSFNGVQIFYSSPENDLENNKIQNNDYGVIIYAGSDTNTIRNNFFENNRYAVYLWGCSENEILNNDFRNDGLYVYESYNNSVVDNNVNGKTLVYLENASDVEITNAGQVVAVNSNNITLRNLDLSNTTVGMEFWKVENSSIENSTLLNNKEEGIYLYQSLGIRIEKITLSENRHGVGIESSNKIDVSNCTISLSQIYGIYLVLSNTVNMSNCTISNNSEFGVYLLNSNGNNITNNIISGDNGLYIGYSDNNRIYNNLLNNTYNVTVYSSSNTWNTTLTDGKNILGGNLLGGNAWLSPDGTGYSQTCADSDYNGICDQPYVIDGSETDFLPLTKALPMPPPSTPATPPSTPATPIPTTTIRPLVGGGGSGGGGFIQGVPIYVSDYIRILAYEDTEFIVPQSAFWETNTFSLTFNSTENVTARLRIEKLNNTPADFAVPEGKVMLPLKISLTFSGDAKIWGTINFAIESEDLNKSGLDSNEVAVVLLKWDGKQWIELPTKFVGSDGKYSYYEAETPSFSYFVAVLKPLEASKPTTPTTPVTTSESPETIKPTTTASGSIPGFEAIFAIAGLLAMAYVLRRKS